MVKILNCEPSNYSADARAILKEAGVLQEECCDRKRLLELVPQSDILIVRLGHKIDKGIIQCGTRLKAVVSATTGLNHIDLEIARERGVKVLSLKGEIDFLKEITATAELTWGLLLALVRRIPAASCHVSGGGWDRDRFLGNQLRDKILGVVGFGRLGSIVADYGRAFRMRVLACDPHVAKVPSWVERVAISELLEKSDVISLHVSLDKSTAGFFDRYALECVKPNAVLVNTARGELVDEGALIAALENGRIAGAAVDVLAGESAQDPHWPCENALWQYAQTHNNVIITSHIGGVTFESMAESEIFMARKVVRFVNDHLR